MYGKGIVRCLFIQQKMKSWTHTAEFKILAFSAVTANMLELDLFEKVCIRSLRQVATLI